MVDDDESMRIVLAGALHDLGVSVEVLDDGDGVPEAIAMRHFDLVIIDLYMAGMNGFEVLRRIRRPETGVLQGGPTSANVPVLVVSGESDAASISNARARGANDFLVKPIDLAVFEDRVRKLIGVGS